jgi:hypothetical protein
MECKRNEYGVPNGTNLSDYRSKNKAYLPDEIGV